MKITRRKLKKIMSELLDTSSQTSARPTAYNQASNSERAAFIASMNIAGESKDEKLEEGTVTRFPSNRARPSQVEDEGQDPVGPAYTIQPYGTDLAGDTASLETDEEDMTASEIEMLRQIMGKRKEVSKQARSSDVQDMEDDIEDLANAFMMGNMADLFADED